MTIPPKYFLTSKMTQLLQQIEGAKEVVNSVNIPPEIEINIRRQSTLKSSLYSARIEGNTLTMNELDGGVSRDQKKVEVFNILKGLNQIANRGYKDLSMAEILNYHRLVMANLLNREDLGQLRAVASAIFNSAGIAVYVPPSPSQVTPLLVKLVSYINSSKEPLIPVKAVLAHYIFEKIHPFIDGNGRVGRLVLQVVLKKHGYDLRGLLALEEFLDNHRGRYYEVLDDSEKDVTDFVEFMLEAIAISADEAKVLVLERRQVEAADYLLPRRAEILNIIKEHQLVNFDTIRRRFMAINERTLRYDLKKLTDAGLVKKLGATKGVYYQSVVN